MSRARTLANLGGVTSSATELNLLDGQTDLASQEELDAKPEYNDDAIQTNVALLAFKTAVNGSLAKYSLQDQVIDEYAHASDTSGIDDGPSNNHVLAGGAYSGTASVTPTITHNADDYDTYDDYTWYKWTTVTTSGSFVSNTTQDIDYLVVAGGGGGGQGNGYTGANGGSGAGGLLTAANLSLPTSHTYTITVGAGGARATGTEAKGSQGGASKIAGGGITDIITTGGGPGGIGTAGSNTGGDGGSGGGAGGISSGASGGTRTASPVQGNDGGDSSGSGGSGGGGAGQEGAGSASGSVGVDGGDGVKEVMGMDDDASTLFLADADAGHNTGGYRWFAGGGGGSNNDNDSSSGLGGKGGGGNAAGNPNWTAAFTSPLPNAFMDEVGGGAGGAGYNNVQGVEGGSGIVIIRRITNVETYNNLTLQSTDTAAEAVPTKADIVMLIEDTAGTATVGGGSPDIRAYISRDSGADIDDSWTQATLTDEGDWGANKRILVAHDVSLTDKNSGQAMCYKITTHNQSSSLETKIHATSIGWR